MTYIDDQGDEIIVAGDDDLLSGYYWAQLNGGNLKFNI